MDSKSMKYSHQNNFQSPIKNLKPLQFPKEIPILEDMIFIIGAGGYGLVIASNAAEQH